VLSINQDTADYIPEVDRTNKSKYYCLIYSSVKIVAVVPAYNESDTIGEVVSTTREYVDEVVVVDDGSDDRTAEVARNHGATVVTHIINTGVGGAVRTGYQYAIRNDYDLVVQIDGDGQHDPAYLPDMLTASEDYDMVIGSRYLNESIEDYSLVRRVGIKFFTGVVNLLGSLDLTDVTSGYRIYRVSMLEDILHHSDKHWAVEQTLQAANSGYRIQEISVKMPTRGSGASQFDIETFVMYPVRMIDTIIRILVFR
jgi:glycosyltransferase involved in cell wall biosynthesis